MRTIGLLLLMAGTALGAPFTPTSNTALELKWQSLPSYPIAADQAFVGCVGGTNIVAGQAGIWLLAGEQWIKTTAALPAEMAPGAAVAVGGGLICVSGSAVVKLVPQGADVVVVRLPEMPRPMEAPGAAVMGGRLYVVGNGIAALHLASNTWESVELRDPRGQLVDPFGTGLRSPMVGVRTDENAGKEALHVFGGGRADCWKYVPGSNSRSGWIKMADLPDGVTPVSCGPLGPAHLLVATAENRLVLYHSFTGKWVEHGRLSEPGRLAASDAGLVWAGSSPWRLGFQWNGKRFGKIDFAVIIVYMAGMIGVGEYFRRREKTAKDFLLGGQRIPWWAAGLSIWATGVSAISYMAIPAKTYAFDWSYVSLGIWPPLTTIVVAYLFIPLLRRLQIVSITDYMEMRFGRSVRVPTTILTILSGILGRLATVLLLPSLALSAVTGWPVWISIVSMGVITTIYTVAGGMSAVVWTDVAQTVVMFGGVILALVLVVMNVDGGFAGAMSIALEHQKLRAFDFAWDFSVATAWVFVLWAFVDMWGKLGQEGLQRAFSTKDVKSARRAMVTCALVSIPGTVLFYGIGTALFAFYSQHPERLNPTLPTDGIFPLFILQQLPTGVAGLIIAGIFAAAMSTLSGMNSYATIIVQDFCAYFGKDTPDHRRLLAARWVTFLCGVLATAGAYFLSTLNNRSLWDTFTKATAFLGGGMGCVMVLALLTKRGNTIGVWTGIIVGFPVAAALELFKVPVSIFLYGVIATAVSCTVGYVVSLLTGGPKRDLTGLTLWTLPPQSARENLEPELATK